ncbi:MAG: DUF4286 family protein [Bradymonadia bacterium]
MPVIYEVNLTIDEAIAEAYGQWLGHHIDEMLAIEGFEQATWLEVHGPPEGKVQWVVCYTVSSAEHLERYFSHWAPKMRGDGLERFGGRFTATRRVMGLKGG